MCHVSCVMCNLSCVMCHVSCVMCHVSPVTCHMSCVPCHMSHFFYTGVKLVGGGSVTNGTFPSSVKASNFPGIRLFLLMNALCSEVFHDVFLSNFSFSLFSV